VARVTSKRQVTIPKTLAERYEIAAGDEVEFLPAGAAIRVQPLAAGPGAIDTDRRLELFDRATERQRAREKGKRGVARGARGWRREDLYERGSAR